MRMSRLADVSKRLLLAADSLHRYFPDSDAIALAAPLLRSLGIASGEEIATRDSSTRSGLRAAPAPGSRSGGTGHYPPMAHFRAELAELRERTESNEGGDEYLAEPELIRRIAELVELLEGEPAALPWWHRAALAGDPLAAAVIEDLDR
jgi:hypothetical protein